MNTGQLCKNCKHCVVEDGYDLEHALCAVGYLSQITGKPTQMCADLRSVRGKYSDCMDFSPVDESTNEPERHRLARGRDVMIVTEGREGFELKFPPEAKTTLAWLAGKLPAFPSDCEMMLTCGDLSIHFSRHTVLKGGSVVK